MFAEHGAKVAILGRGRGAWAEQAENELCSEHIGPRCHVADLTSRSMKPSQKRSLPSRYDRESDQQMPAITESRKVMENQIVNWQCVVDVNPTGVFFNPSEALHPSIRRAR